MTVNNSLRPLRSTATEIARLGLPTSLKRTSSHVGFVWLSNWTMRSPSLTPAWAAAERYGRWTAIVAVGVLFGLAHGLVVSLPVIAAFGMVLAWIRSVTGSVFPGMLLHSLFNLVALVAAVTING